MKQTKAKFLALLATLTLVGYTTTQARLVYRNPWTSMLADFENMHERMEKLFGATKEMTSTNNRAHVEQRDDKTVISVELPGFAEEDIAIGVTEDNGVKYLTIKAEKKSETKTKTKSPKDAEEDDEVKESSSYAYASRSFSYRYLLDKQDKSDKIKADYENGLLTITIQREKAVETKKVRTIKINN